MGTATQHSIQMLHSSANGMPHGLGLLTTVASLPPKYRSRYLNIKTKSEIPLDLSVKPPSPQIANDVPMATTFTEVYTEPSSEPESSTSEETIEIFGQRLSASVHSDSGSLPGNAAPIVTITKISKVVKPITPPPTPTKRRHIEFENGNDAAEERVGETTYANPEKLPKTNEDSTNKRECTPVKPIRSTDSAPRTAKSQPPVSKPTKNKATRKLKFDEETSSPVSGTIIRPLEDITDGAMQYSNGDIDPKYNIVEITEETKAELAAIKNVIGDYICKLCRLKFDDAFGLARHRCACIVLLEYRCPECGKQFNCPANLASHRRWHKPKKEGALAKKENRNTTNNTSRPTPPPQVNKKNEELAYGCRECGKKFKRQAYLRKHQLTHANAKKHSHQAAGKERTQPAEVANATNAEASAGATAAARACPSYASSSASSMHSYSGTQEDEALYNASNGYDYEADSMSECSNSSGGYGRLQIVESGLTEEENIAAAALTNLRNCASVIQHTTLAH